MELRTHLVPINNENGNECLKEEWTSDEMCGTP